MEFRGLTETGVLFHAFRHSISSIACVLSAARISSREELYTGAKFQLSEKNLDWSLARDWTAGYEMRMRKEDSNGLSGCWRGRGRKRKGGKLRRAVKTFIGRYQFFSNSPHWCTPRSGFNGWVSCKRGNAPSGMHIVSYSNVLHGVG